MICSSDFLKLLKYYYSCCLFSMRKFYIFTQAHEGNKDKQEVLTGQNPGFSTWWRFYAKITGHTWYCFTFYLRLSLWGGNKFCWKRYIKNRIIPRHVYWKTGNILVPDFCFFTNNALMFMNFCLIVLLHWLISGFYILLGNYDSC